MSSGIDGALIFEVLAGIGILLVGAGIFVACSGLARTFARLNTTLDEVDAQIAALSGPVVKTLDHIDGIAGTADSTVARLGVIVGTLEGIAGGVGKTAKLATDAVEPAVVNVGAALTGVTAGLRRLLSGRRGAAPAPAPYDGSVSSGG
ncbi:MAG: hypothetical protein JWM87_2698 [Candidatus Eremiobacteraeota bacterium]|nr:hypothetical protein [Candidatus Eremiobacteraeota bacterium]